MEIIYRIFSRESVTGNEWLIAVAGERPHRCDQCEKSFKDRSLLIRHKRTHGKERPFSCAHCNKVFLSKSELRRHLTVHSGASTTPFSRDDVISNVCKFRLFPPDEKPFSCEYCQTLFRRKDNLNRHIRHHHTEDFNCEIRKAPSVVEADRASSTKSGQQRQKQKSKRTQPRSAGKVAATLASSRDQINSRLDPMGNITPVIRATGEVSNAVPVINGPINIRRLEDRIDRKIFTYTEPIPIAEAVELNCRIEEKLYPQSANSHNYFVRSYLRDKNSKVNSYPNNKPMSQENHSFVAAASSQTETPPPRATVDQRDPTTGVYKERLAGREEEKSNQNENGSEKEDERNRDRRNFKDHDDPSAVSFRESNCVSTIKKHTTQQSEGCSSENSASSDLNATNYTSSKDSQNNHGKKQSDMHWRRKIAERR